MHRTRRPIVLAALTALTLTGVTRPTPSAAQTTRPADVVDQAGAAATFSLTVYSTADPASFDPKTLARQAQMNRGGMPMGLPGYGVVRERRSITPDDDGEVRFTGVASGIDPTTVSFRSLTDPDAAVVEQSYEFDLVSGDKLLDKYVGRPITLDTLGSGGAEGERLSGRLLSFDGGTLVLNAGDGVRVIPRGQIAGLSLPADAQGSLVTEPTLVWAVASDVAGPHDAEVSYQTDGLTWRADYALVTNADSTAADVTAWVTLMNRSGLSYPETRLKLVAGDVQRVTPPQAVYAMEMARAATTDAGPAGFEQKSFFEYHLYTLGRTTSLPDNSTKQIELFEARQGVPIQRTYVYYGLPDAGQWFFPRPVLDRDLGTQSNTKVDVYLTLENAEENGMGVPLPAGRVRVYLRDEADDSLEFVGEDVIRHTPREEQVRVRLGTAFDLVGERRQTDLTVDNARRTATESFEIKLRNRKTEPATIVVKENLYRWSTWEIVEASHAWEKQDARTIHIPVEVEPDEEATVTYTVRYTW